MNQPPQESETISLKELDDRIDAAVAYRNTGVRRDERYAGLVVSADRDRADPRSLPAKMPGLLGLRDRGRPSEPETVRVEAHGFEVWLVNARDVKHLPGRPKTDKLDAVWLCKAGPDPVPGRSDRFLLGTMIARVEAIEADIREVGARIEEHVAPFAPGGDPVA